MNKNNITKKTTGNNKSTLSLSFLKSDSNTTTA